MRNYKQYTLPELHYTGGDVISFDIDIKEHFGDALALDENTQCLSSYIPFVNRQYTTPYMTFGNYIRNREITLPTKTILFRNDIAWVSSVNSSGGQVFCSYIVDSDIAKICNTNYMQDGVFYKFVIGGSEYDSAYQSSNGSVVIGGNSYSYIGKFTDSQNLYCLYVMQDHGILLVSTATQPVGVNFKFSLIVRDPLTVTIMIDDGSNVTLDWSTGILSISIDSDYTKSISGKYIYQISLALNDGDLIRQGIMFLDRNIDAG